MLSQPQCPEFFVKSMENTSAVEPGNISWNCVKCVLWRWGNTSASFLPRSASHNTLNFSWNRWKTLRRRFFHVEPARILWIFREIDQKHFASAAPFWKRWAGHNCLNLPWRWGTPRRMDCLDRELLSVSFLLLFLWDFQVPKIYSNSIVIIFNSCQIWQFFWRPRISEIFQNKSQNLSITFFIYLVL